MNGYFKGESPTRTIKTENFYLQNFERLRRQFMVETRCYDMLPDEVVANLIVNKQKYSMSTWRLYKNSTIFVLEKYYPQCQIATETLSQESSSGLSKSSKKTSGQKQKFVPPEIWEAIQKVLLRRIIDGHKHSRGLLTVLTATLLTGLRPCEWINATITVHKKTGRKIMRVKNAKHTNGRANGEFRELFIDELLDAEQTMLASAINYCRSCDDESAQRIQLALTNEFKIIKNQAPDHMRHRKSLITMYDFRHQFIADAKMTFSNPVIIAALVGHNSTKTAFEHYGKRSKGSSKVRVLPTPETMVAVLNSEPSLKQFSTISPCPDADNTPAF